MHLLALGALWWGCTLTLGFTMGLSLNVPFGARCFLTRAPSMRRRAIVAGLNALFGARCFLTRTAGKTSCSRGSPSLNAPFGARCFLTFAAPGAVLATSNKS